MEDLLYNFIRSYGLFIVIMFFSALIVWQVSDWLEKVKEIEEDKKEKGEKPSILVWCSKFWWILVVASLLSLGLKT